MRTYQDVPNISDGGWTLVSAEERNLQNPETFEIPSLDLRASLSPGSAVKLLFEIETYVDGALSDRGVDRMWVIVTTDLNGGYQGFLDSTPGSAEGLALDRGDLVYFSVRTRLRH